MKDEINLLPKQFQVQRARGAYIRGIGKFLRRLYILLALLLLAELAIWWAVVALADRVSTERERQADGSVVEQVVEVNMLLGAVERELAEHTSWSLLIEDVLAQMPESVQLSSVAGGGDGLLVLEGTSSSRSAVVTFQERLQELPWVTQIDAPLQNFALGPDATFSFSLHLKE